MFGRHDLNAKCPTCGCVGLIGPMCHGSFAVWWCPGCTRSLNDRDDPPIILSDD